MRLKKFYLYSRTQDKWRKVAQWWSDKDAPQITINEGDSQREIVTAHINNGRMWQEVVDGDNYADSFEKDGETVYIVNLFYSVDLYELETTRDTLYFIDDYECDKYIDNHNLVACAHCGTYIELDDDYDYIYDEHYGNYYCNEDCLNDDDLYLCNECGAVCNDEHRDAHGNYYCNHCSESLVYCPRCDEFYHDDEMNYSEDDDEYYCNNCYEERERENARKLKSYHTSKDNGDYKFFRGKEHDNDGLYIGCELEIECKNNDNEEMAERIDEILNDNDTRAFFERDGSLCNGVEIISQPATINAWRGEFMQRYKQALAMLENNGCRSHDGGACGLHFHLTRNYFTQHEIARLLFIIARYQDKLVTLSRRKSFDYCHTYCDSMKNLSINEIEERLQRGSFSSDRYVVLNLRNIDTIEYRLTRGTLNVATFFASIELVYNMAQYVKTKSDNEIKNGTFNDILNVAPTTHLLQYASDKGVA